MGAAISILGVGVDEVEVAGAAAAGRRLAEHWEAVFSRFRADSQLSRLNAANGAAVRVDLEFLDLLEIARAAVAATDGRFDPSILAALEAYGYDRSFELVHPGDGPTVGRSRPGFGAGGWAEVLIDRGRGEARLPRGMRIDLGGLAKGAFVDRLATDLGRWPGGCIDAGGDLLAWGCPPSGDEWIVGIEDPTAPDRDALEVRFAAGPAVAVATSGIHRRRWETGGGFAHHLIDPRTGSPTSGVVLSATAIARTVTGAEIATKALIVAAAEGGPRSRFGASLALVFGADGSIDVLDDNPATEELRDAYPTSTARRAGRAA